MKLLTLHSVRYREFFMQKLAVVRLVIYFRAKTSTFKFKKTPLYCIDKLYLYGIGTGTLNFYIVVKPDMLFGLT